MMMGQLIDIGKLKDVLAPYASEDVVRADFTRAYFDRVVAEIIAGRDAMDELEQLRAGEGRVFGLPPEERL